MSKQLNTDRETVIVGLGLTGLSCARFLAARGVDFAITDSRENPPGLAELQQNYPDTPTRCGELDADLILRSRQCLVSPGISIRHPLLIRAAQTGVEVIGDIELFARTIKAPVIAVTGANGKSTVTTLVYEMARACGMDVRAGGNLGTPALDLIMDHEPDLYVLELSSFQLETTHSLNPVAATVLNISEDHMDRYSGLADYAVAKARIFAGDGVMVLNADDPAVAGMSQSGRQVTHFTLRQPAQNEFGTRQDQGQEWLAFGEQTLMPASDMKIQGRHNIANALAALALGRAAGLDMQKMLGVLRSWPGLPHRCQWVAEHNGINWYNDSKGTNEGATVAAIEGFANTGNIILIAGGDAKGARFDDLAAAVKGRVRHVILLGKDAPLLERVLHSVASVERVTDMQQAVVFAHQIARKGDRVLMSPACASLDMFANYAARGEAFVKAVREVVQV